MTTPIVEAHDNLVDRTRHCLGVVVEVWQTLDEHVRRLCVIGGWAVYALSESSGITGTQTPPHHRGSVDVDIALAWSELSAQTAAVVARRLTAAGYLAPPEGSFRWSREHPDEEDPFAIDLMATHPPGHRRGAMVVGGQAWAPFWDGHTAVEMPQQVVVRAVVPSGEMAEQTVTVAGRAGLLYAKAQILFARNVEPETIDKHLHDVYYLIRT